MKAFVDQNFDHLKDTTVFLDVDGTLVPDSGKQLLPNATAKVAELAKHNVVYLCSNGGRVERDRTLARELNIKHLESIHKKPSKRLLDEVSEKTQALVVIGDKLLTDGRFAFAIGAEFIKVARPSAQASDQRDSLFSKFVELLDDVVSYLWAVVNIIRPINHVRNGLILAPLFFAGDALQWSLVAMAVLAVLAFSLLAGAVYIGNDIIDYDDDRRHPKKRRRMLPAGYISVPTAVVTAVVMLFASAYLVWAFLPQAWWLYVAYLFANVAYSLYFKHVVVVDIVLVALFYLVRILIGGVAIGVAVSAWLILTTLFLALFIVIGKRLAEVKGVSIRVVSGKYSQAYLENLLTIVSVAVLLSYGIYCVLGADDPLLVYSIVFVVYGLFRYLYILYTHDHGEFPEQVVLRDKTIMVAVLGWLVFVSYIFYW